MGLLISGSAWGGAGTLGSALAPSVSAISGAPDPTCSSQQYKENVMDPQQKAMAPYMKATCDKCKASVSKWKSQAPADASAASAADSGIASSATPGINSASNGVDAQLVSQNNASGKNYSPASAAQGQRSANANAAASKLQACVADIEASCSGGMDQQDKAAADKVKEGCQKAAQDAGKFGSEKAADAADMGDLSKLAQMAAGALGPLMQAMQGKGNQGNGGGNQSGLTGPSDYGGTSPTPDSVNTSTSTADVKNPISGTDLGASKTAPSGTGFSVPNGLQVGMGQGNGANGAATGAKASPSASGDYGSGRNFGASTGFGANGLGSGAGMMGMGGSAGTLGALGSSSGASKSGDFKNGDGAAGGAGEAGKDENGYDLASGSRPLLGLKGKTNEAAELEGMAGANNEPRPEDGEKGDRELASTSPDGEEGRGAAGLSLFHMVRTRYAELKRSGRI